MNDFGDVATVREAVLSKFAGTDIEYAWRRIEAMVLRVGYATDIHQLAEALEGWRTAEQYAIERRRARKEQA